MHSVEDVKKFFESVPHKIPAKKLHNNNEGNLTTSPFNKEGNIEKPPLETGDGGGFSDGKNTSLSYIVALGNSGDPSTIPEIIFTKSKNSNERRLATSALGELAQFKPHIYTAVEPLEALLDDEKPQVRQYALKAIAKIGMLNMEKLKSKLKSFIENTEEKYYNIALAKRLIMNANNLNVSRKRSHIPLILIKI